MKRSWIALTLLASFAALVQCKDGTAPQPEPPAPASLLLSPDSISLHVGQTLQMHLLVLDSAGDPLDVAQQATWSSTDTSVIAVSSGGLAAGHSYGTAVITAHLDTLQASAYLRVLIPVADVMLSPYAVMLVPGGTLQLTAELTGADGSTLSDRDVTWRHQSTAISIAPATGMIKGLAVGSDSITTVSEGVESRNHVRVAVSRPQFTHVIANSLSSHVCALTATGEAYCWGSNGNGALGNGTFGDSLGHVRFRLPDSTGGIAYPTGIPSYQWTALEVGEGQTCGVVSGQVACWGVNDEYSLGNGPGADRSSPNPVILPRPTTSVIVGEEWACALGTDSLPYCWGGSVTGFLVRPTAFTARKYVSIYAGYKMLCGIGADSLAYCGFPRNNAQQLVSPTLKFTKLTIGYQHGCGIAADSVAYCWGNNNLGQLGDSTQTSRATPAPVAGSHKFRDLSAGFDLTCGVEAGTGTGYCWGFSLFVAQPPPQVLEFLTAPSPVPGNLEFSQITAGGRFACGIATGKVYCWGSNLSGQLGDGTATDRTVPTLVVGQQP